MFTFIVLYKFRLLLFTSLASSLTIKSNILSNKLDIYFYLILLINIA